MEIIEDRHARKAIIIASQLPVANWFDIFKEETLADAILDRIVHTSHRFEIKGETSRKMNRLEEVIKNAQKLKIKFQIPCKFPFLVAKNREVTF